MLRTARMDSAIGGRNEIYGGTGNRLFTMIYRLPE
jgi:hypothetical protein